MSTQSSSPLSSTSRTFPSSSESSPDETSSPADLRTTDESHRTLPYGAWVGEWRGGEAGAEEEPELNAGRAGAREGLTCQEIEGRGRRCQ